MLAKIPMEGNIVEDYYRGNTHILFFDASYIHETPEELDRRVSEMNQKALNIYIKYELDHPDHL